MNWISDLLKDIPLSTVLKEKIATKEEEYKKLEGRADDVERQVRHAERRPARLRGAR